MNLDKLLEKVLLEAEMLDLKANPNKKAQGTVIESTLDKGRGYVSTILVQSGTLHVGDVILSGTYTGRVKAMFNENGKKVDSAGPSTPVQVLGLNGAPQAGDTFNVMEDDRSAREIANKREQLQRMQGIMTQKHVTLDEIGRRIACLLYTSWMNQPPVCMWLTCIVWSRFWTNWWMPAIRLS